MPLHALAQDAVFEITPLIPPEKVADWFVKFFPDLEELNAIAKRSKRRKDAQGIIEKFDMPLMVGDIALYRLSVGALEWLEECPQRWWGADAKNPNFRLLELATIYAMGHRLKEDFNLLTSEPHARKTIMKWAKSTKVSEDVLMIGASYLLPENDPIARIIMGGNSDTDSEVDISRIAQKVSELSGINLVSCIWEMSADMFWNIYTDYMDSQEDELNANLKAAKKAQHVETWVVMQKVALIKSRRKLLKSTKDWLETLSNGAKVKEI